MRQSIALGRRLGAHDEACSVAQLVQLETVSEVGVQLIERLQLRMSVEWFGGLEALMMARIGVATQRTILLEARIQAERALTPAEREAAQKAHVAAARRRRKRGAGVSADAVPGPVPPAAVDAAVAGLAQALGADEDEADVDGVEPPDDVVCDATLLPEDFGQPSVEAEIGGRSLAEIADEACRVTGVEPEPELFANEALPTTAATPSPASLREEPSPAARAREEVAGPRFTAGLQARSAVGVVGLRRWAGGPPYVG